MPALKSIPARCLQLAIVFSLVLLPTCLQAQDDPDETQPIFSMGKRPFVVIAASSANELKQKATFLFESAGYPDAVDTILTRLDENANGLSGLDWDRPAGIMVFLNSVFPPAFELVAFLPMSNVEDFRSMMELGPVVMREDPLEEGRFELITQRRNVQIRTHGDYAFIQLPPMDPDPAFDRDLPDPVTLTAGLVNQFDVGIMLDVEAVPKGTRDLILNVLTSTMSTQIQQRDGEPEGTYRMRKAWMQADIDAFKLMMDELQRMSIGIRLTPDSPGAQIDMVMDVREGTKLLEAILASGTKPSYFTPLLTENSPISLSWSGMMAEWDIERYNGVLEGLKSEVARVVEENNLGQVPTEGSPLFAAINALQATVQEGHFDFFGQMYRDSADKIAVITALRVEDGNDVAAGLQDLLMRVQGNADIGEIRIGDAEHAGITFHRLEFKNPDAGANELFGADPGVSVGVGPRSMWVCLGGDQSFDVLKNVMDELTEAYENPTTREVPASMRLVIKTNELIQLVQGAEEANRKRRNEGDEAALDAAKTIVEGAAKEGKGNEEVSAQAARWQKRREAREARNQVFLDSLAENGDRIQVDVRPTENGVRTRLRFDAGFVIGVGKMIGASIEENN